MASMTTSLMIGSALVKALSNIKIFEKVKKPLSAVLGISKELPKAKWIEKVKGHLDKHPLAYSTLLGTLSSFAPEAIDDVFKDVNEIPEATSVINQILKGTDYVPPSLLSGGDGYIDTVWGQDEDDFTKGVDRVFAAKKVVQEASNILGITPEDTIALATLLRSIEPQFAQLYKPTGNLF